MIKYFVVYDFETDEGVWKQNGVLEWPKPINSIEDINEIQEVIVELNGYKAALITNFIRLED